MANNDSCTVKLHKTRLHLHSFVSLSVTVCLSLRVFGFIEPEVRSVPSLLSPASPLRQLRLNQSHPLLWTIDPLSLSLSPSGASRLSNGFISDDSFCFGFGLSCEQSLSFFHSFKQQLLALQDFTSFLSQAQSPVFNQGKKSGGINKTLMVMYISSLTFPLFRATQLFYFSGSLYWLLLYVEFFSPFNYITFSYTCMLRFLGEFGSMSNLSNLYRPLVNL